jgi:DNA-binding transcriptional regulator YiaG
LYWGSAKRNTSDRDERGRRKGPVGVAHHKAKLNPDKVREIRRLANTLTQRELAAVFGVAQGVIWNVIHRKFWKEVDD